MTTAIRRDQRKPVLGAKLELRNVHKSFAAHQVLRGLTLELEAGEFVAIVGRSGCGKSTMLRLLAGLDTPTSGELLFDGCNIRGIVRFARMMFQDTRLLPWQTVGANVRLGLDKRLYEEADRLLREVGLLDRSRDYPAVLSGGQRQRVALARALASHPRLLLLDEPLGSVDALTRIEMQQLIEALWQDKGFTAVLVTHDVEEAVVLADRVLVMDAGTIGLEVEVDLPRPRARGNVRFGQLVERILDHILRPAGSVATCSPDQEQVATEVESEVPIPDRSLV